MSEFRPTLNLEFRATPYLEFTNTKTPFEANANTSFTNWDYNEISLT